MPITQRHVLSDSEPELSALDILDALATCDLVLEDDEGAQAFLAYMELIKAETTW